MADPHTDKCAHCGVTIFGGPGGWHGASGAERCGASPTSFHEADPHTDDLPNEFATRLFVGILAFILGWIMRSSVETFGGAFTAALAAVMFGWSGLLIVIDRRDRRRRGSDDG